MASEQPQTEVTVETAAANPWASAASQTDTATAPAAGMDNPWGEMASPVANPADVGSVVTEPAAISGSDADWLAGVTGADNMPDQSFDWLNPFDHAQIPLDDWVTQGLDWAVSHFRPAFQAVRLPIDATLTSIEQSLQAVHPVLMVILMALIAWQVSGRRLAMGTALSLLCIGLIGAWQASMVTLALVLTSVFFCLVLGLPLGILMARSDRVERVLRPLLDAMQTTPAFVYLVPVVMLFGIGNVPGVVVTIIFALPPLIRLTSLGIRQVRGDLIEASHAFGASPWQMLTQVQLPLAMPTIMAGVNQTLMLSLSMVVIASMIAVGGLGQMVLRGIGRLDMGLASVGGLGIVILAIVLDRMTQAMSRQDRSPGRKTLSGPLGAVVRWFKPHSSHGVGATPLAGHD